jgi:hypothetical protein
MIARTPSLNAASLSFGNFLRPAISTELNRGVYVTSFISNVLRGTDKWQYRLCEVPPLWDGIQTSALALPSRTTYFLVLAT